MKIHKILRKINNFKRDIITVYWCLKSGIKYKNGYRISGRIYVIKPNIFHSKSFLFIGEKFHSQSNINENLYGIIQPNVLNIISPNSSIIIGNNVGISGSTITATEKITIGNNVLIGSGCIICDSDAHPIHPLDRKDCIKKTKSSPIVIEDDVFIGARSIILKGVRIGHGSVIGAGSVVTKDIPPMSIAAGNPARIIKYI